MASLSTALNYAVAGLRVNSAQTSLISRNISYANDPDYVRKTADLTRLPGGAISVASYSRSADRRLLDKLLDTSSGAAGKQVALDALAKLAATIGDPESDGSITGLVAKLQQGLQNLEADPSNTTLGSEAFRRASDLALGLNQASASVQQTRAQADQDMAASVDHINSLLAQFKVANDAVVRGAGTAADLTDSLDQRDRILKQLSEEVGIRTTTRANNDIAIYTDSGVTLFETNARSVSFDATSSFDATTTGNAVYVDGVKITGVPSIMPSRAGKLQALAEIRDRVAVTYQTQLDEVARSLIESFAEQDQSGSALADQAGLFTYGGAPAVPPSGVAVAGLATQIATNSLADPGQGGNVALIRDGGFNGAAYVYNTTGAAGFQDRIAGLIAGLDAPRSFDAAAQLGGSASLKDFSASASGWVEQKRQAADAELIFHVALKSRANEALLRRTGVNIDDEMTTMLDLEKAYQASSKVIAAVDGMLKTLLDAVN
jgi:flagellar hook-associated protein 1 FlgK